jgi:hypothetical protein
VHAEAAADPADGCEQVQELGAGGQELAELVDDDQQVGQRFELWVQRTPGGVGLEIRQVPLRCRSRWRLTSSPWRAAMARSTIDRSDCRFVMRPATCGTRARLANIQLC